MRAKLPSKIWTDEEETRAIGMFRAGISTPKIAGKIGCSESQIRSLFRRKKIKSHMTGRSGVGPPRTARIISHNQEVNEFFGINSSGGEDGIF